MFICLSLQVTETMWNDLFTPSSKLMSPPPPAPSAAASAAIGLGMGDDRSLSRRLSTDKNARARQANRVPSGGAKKKERKKKEKKKQKKNRAEQSDGGKCRLGQFF